MRYNIFLLLDVGTFSALVELLNMEIEYVFCMLLNLRSCHKSCNSMSDAQFTICIKFADVNTMRPWV